MKAFTYITSDRIQDKLTRAALLVAMLGLLSACGAQTTARSSASSGGYSGPTVTVGTTTTTTGTATAECSYFDSSAIRLAGKVTTYYWNGTIQEDKIRLRFTGLADNFDSTSTVYIKFFRWKVDSTGTASLDSNPLNFTVYNGSSGSQALSGSITSLSAADIARIRTNNNISGTTSLDFLNQTTLVIDGVDYNWNALKIVMYNGTDVLGQTDMLLPVFLANPNAYALSHVSVLNQLHPFWSQRTTSATEADWQNRSMSYCF